MVLWRFCRNRSGATAVEYGLIAGAIACAIVVSLKSIGTNINGVFDRLTPTFK